MIGADSIIFTPLVPWGMLWAGLALAVVAVAFAALRGLPGWPWRALAALLILAALANPALQRESRKPLPDIVLLVADRSASQTLGDRARQTDAALARLRSEITALPNTRLREITVTDAPGDGGTLAMTAIAKALAGEPRARIAGVIMVSDGQVHDVALAPDIPAPLNLVLTGHASDWDRRLVVKNAPAYGIMGEPVKLMIRIEDQGRVPASVSKIARIAISIDGAAPRVLSLPAGQDHEIPVTLPHAGNNVIQITTAAQPGELTARNNSAVVQVNGVRDRLRVLLISGEPYPGERVWRNLLKSDASVDLVHFTILRPPEKQDGVPIDQLALIAFPTHELFVQKIKQFDLIIFDRYRRRGILPAQYLDNIRQYVLGGGALLVEAGPDFGSAESLYRSPLADILPVVPTSRVIARGFRPEITALGQRHPVTEGLAAFGPKGRNGKPGWGRWLRQIEVSAKPGAQTVMSGIDGKPLLVLAHEGKGRVSVLASDQAWLWSRDYEGGGPQLELLRRLAHWMMKEPSLEEEALRATATGRAVTIVRRSLKTGPRSVTITGPGIGARPGSGTGTGAGTGRGTGTGDKAGTASTTGAAAAGAGSVTLPMKETAPGRYVAQWQAPTIGLYRLRQGRLHAVVGVGPAAPREFEETIATADKLAPLLARHRGGAVRIEDAIPEVRQVRVGAPAAGRGWVGVTPRDAYVVENLKVVPLLPAWAMLLLVALASLVAWLREGRR